jgi:GNAT superfamily N-acetyltransferase
LNGACVPRRTPTGTSYSICTAKQSAMYVELLWGWDEGVQRRLFDERFASRPFQVIQANGEDIGVLQLQDRPEEVVLDLIELLPAWQGKGIGTAVIRSLFAQGKAVGLRVLDEQPESGCPLRAPRVPSRSAHS